MAYHVAKQSGGTIVGDKPEEQKKIKFKEGDILEDYSKKDLEHCPQLEYKKGKAPDADNVEELDEASEDSGDES